MPHLVLGPTPAGRFPRWGYLDRIETNEAMPRAGAVALFGSALAMLAVVVAQHLFEGPKGSTRPQRAEAQQAVHMLSRPLPPPSIALKPGAPELHVPKYENPVPIPVDEIFAEKETLPDSPGNGSGDEGMLGAPGSEHGDGLEYGAIPELWVPPAPEDFVPFEQAPELVTMHEPVYPELARAAGIEGTVLVRVLVGEDGFVKEALLLQGVLGLDEAALAAAGTAVFRPARQQERPIAVWVVIPIEFRLRP